MCPALKSFITSPVRPHAIATIAATSSASFWPIELIVLTTSRTNIPKISIGFIPDCPTHCDDIDVVSQTPIIVITEAIMPRLQTYVSTNTSKTRNIGAHLIGRTESPVFSLLNIAPNIFFKLGSIPLIKIPIPVPTIIPSPSDCLMSVACCKVKKPNFCPKIRIPKSPTTAPKNQTPINKGPTIYPIATSIGEI